ncbi:60S ribosomal protein L22-2 [Artemisia annua]|uniref:60S ribosomal protein L22-2 n=1 Tax=Artemisia annua TaxID=35608 RepID=A0A2U1MPS7_ARTAN|nr:60S ribosomal protein L22-2 [Artemisia annua]
MHIETPPECIEGNNGYIMVTANGGINQQRVAYLKKHNVRDWLRVIASNKDHNVYELRYFNIAENEGEEED